MDKIPYTEENLIRFPSRPDYTSESKLLNNVIIYKASRKLIENEATGTDGGVKVNKFNNGNITIVDHSFDKGIGVITFSDDVTSIGEYCFNFSPIIEISIPNTVTVILNNAFSNCGLLLTIKWPTCLFRIGDYAFQYCSSLQNLTLPKNVTRIGYSAFLYCENLKSVTIENGVTTIDSLVFLYCYNLKTANIPNSVTTLGSYIFNYCFGLDTVEIDMTSIPSSFSYVQSKNIIFGEHVTSISPYSVGNCYMIKSIVIPENITQIGSGAFGQCYSLHSVTISKGDIGGSAFGSCYGLKNVNILDGVTSIGSYSFQDCYGIKSIKIPSTVTSIGESIFRRSSLQNIIVDEKNKIYDSRNNCNAIIHTETKSLVVACDNTIIPDGILEIKNYAFTNCKNIKTINIPDTVTIIGLFAFSNCSNLIEITIPEHVTSIGQSAFNSAVQLEKITSLNATAPTINSNTFMNVKSDGVLYTPESATGYDVWMQTSNYYLGKYNWTTATIPVTD